MKKFLILIIIILSLTGCYDNIELNDLAIISGIGIDYEDDLYTVTYEILSNTKTLDDTTLKSYTVSGSGKSISDAFIDANYKNGDKSYFAHLKIVVVDKNIINGHMEGINDYLLRDINIRDEFKFVVTNNVSPKVLLKHNNDNIPVVSDYLINLLKNEKYNNNLVIDQNFEDIVKKLVSDNYDVILNVVSIVDDNLSLDNSVILKGNNYKDTLSKKDSSLYNLLNSNVLAVEFDKEYDNKIFSINVNNSKTDIKVTKNKVKINLELEGEVLENNPEFNLKEASTYQKLNKDFEKVIKDDIYNFIKLLQNAETDILGFQEIYYKDTRKNNNDLWITSDISVNVDLKINTKGLIFEVN